MSLGTLGIIGVNALQTEALFEALSEHSLSDLREIKVFDSRSRSKKRFLWNKKEILVQAFSAEAINACQVVLFLSSEYPEYCSPDILTNSGINCINMESGSQYIAFIVSSLIFSMSSTIPNNIFGNLMEGVFAEGKVGFETLTEEVSSFFQTQDLSCKPSSLYPTSLAFNVIPVLENNNNNNINAQVSSDLSKIFGIHNSKLFLSCCKVPVFMGCCGSLFFQYASEINLAQISAQLAQNPMFVVSKLNDDNSDCIISPRDVQGAKTIYIQFMQNEATNVCGLWFAADPLPLMASNICDLLGKNLQV